MLTLADRLIETAADRRWPKPFRQDYEFVARKIRAAQRFIVKETARDAIRSLLISKPSTLVAAASYAKLPFDVCWFEWTPPGYQNLKPGQIEVKRCGAVMERYGEHGYTLFTAWEFDREAMQRDLGGLQTLLPPFGMSCLIAGYDLSSFDQRPIMLERMDRDWIFKPPNKTSDLRALRDDAKNSIKHALSDPAEADALWKLEGRTVMAIHTDIHGYERMDMQRRIAGDVSSLVYDVQDEMGHLFATLILMNAKNSVELTKVEAPEKLNKARRKQGKGELLPYSTVDIKLSKSQERAVAEGRITRAEARRHPVRGHFKVRSTGVFWWNESWRGNALRGTVERRAHMVE